jgi:two-component system, cell cycle sensor histidine kinase and response regulator CckA
VHATVRDRTVHGIVQQSQGSITVSNVPGGGARFEVFLPRAAAGVAAPPPPTAEHIRTAAIRVLLVEDQDVVRRSVARALEGLGHQVTPVGTPEEALSRFRAREHWDLVMTDVVMPGMSGPLLVKQLRNAGWSAPVLLMSAYPDRAEAIEPGDPVLAKPFKREVLAIAVARALNAGAGAQIAGR